MDHHIALSRRIPELDDAAEFLRAELLAHGSTLMRFWDCLTSGDGLAGPSGDCAIEALAWDAESARGRAVFTFPWRANHGCRDILVSGSDRLEVTLMLDASTTQLRISAADRAPAPVPRDEL